MQHNQLYVSHLFKNFSDFFKIFFFFFDVDHLKNVFIEFVTILLLFLCFGFFG